MTTVSASRGLSQKQRKTVAGGAIGTLIEYYDYYLYGLASAAVFPAVFFSSEDPVIAQLSSFATFAVGFFLRPVGGIIWGIIGDRIGRKTVLMSTVIGMGLATTAIGLIPSDHAIGVAAPLLLLFCRLLQGFFVGGEMGGAATMVVEAAPIGKKGLYGAFLISGAGVANVVSGGLMAVLGLTPGSWFLEWGWRIPFVFSIVLAIVAVILRRHLEESDEFVETQTLQLAAAGKKANPLIEVFRHPKNAIMGILIGLPQSIAGYVVLTYGLAFMVGNKHLPAWMGFAGTMIVGLLQIVVAPLWGHISDRIGRRTVYIIGCLGFAAMVYPAFMLFSTGNLWLIWLGQIIGFVVFGVAMQATLATMLAEMFDPEARTTGVNIGYQISNTLGGGLAPLICTALVAAAGGSFWPVVVYAAVIAVVGVIATLMASIRPDVEGAGRLHELAATSTIKTNA
ncbi:MHS family shikimate/dehydroshikimate transporter-like MFS transporter [Microbacterium sp. W4I4]|uniref:MFS transporter n=1 Tax=Microbacterium sp. W4I4 TaxID=3042295 RepID=UPI0027841AF0|nr:MFS transporter [Microbacterium sp. W4I4]MDQ0614527.1 MHS family shikimate/dehydroshikimate transporter-like MFS transporter [Microbacterium sp. W4I4]